MYKGKLIVISGPDQSGKETQSKLLQKAIEYTRGCCHREAFPDYIKDISGPVLDGLLRSKTLCIAEDSDNIQWCNRYFLAKKDLHPASFQLYQAINRINKNKTVLYNLEQGTHVICDRYSIDAFIYGAVDGCEFSLLEELNKLYLKPDLNIILQGPKLQRVETDEDCNERDLSFQEQVSIGYRQENVQVLSNLVGPVTVVPTARLESLTESIFETHQAIAHTLTKILGMYIEPLSCNDISDFMIAEYKEKLRLLKEKLDSK